MSNKRIKILREIQKPSFKSQIALKFQIVILIFSLVCAQQSYNPRLVEYLNAERDLRNSVSEGYGLEDSIEVLRKRYHIDLEKELAKIRENPEAWLRLIKELLNEK